MASSLLGWSAKIYPKKALLKSRSITIAYGLVVSEQVDDGMKEGNEGCGCGPIDILISTGLKYWTEISCVLIRPVAPWA